jgi:hypothetical protein
LEVVARTPFLLRAAREGMPEDQEKGWLSPQEEREKAASIREKKERGETLTREEAGFLGAYASRLSTKHDDPEEHRVKSWMKGEDTRKPRLSRATEREVERIGEKKERGETLTRREAGVLGGASRAQDGKD